MIKTKIFTNNFQHFLQCKHIGIYIYIYIYTHIHTHSNPTKGNGKNPYICFTLAIQIPKTFQ